MYDAISKSINNEFEPDTKAISIGDAYEQLYDKVNRLQDMDDFTNSMLQSINDKVTNGETFKNAFKEVVDNEYEFTDFDYFEQVFNTYETQLFEIFNTAIKSNNPEKSWQTDVLWLFEHETIDINGTQYSLKQLKQKLDKGDEQ